MTDYLKVLAGKMAYLAAPYSDSNKLVVEQRMRELCKVDAKLMKVGVFTVSPLMKHFILQYEQLPGDWEYWQHYSRELLKRVDAIIVVMMPGWVVSRGVGDELLDARRLGISVYYIDEQLNLLGEEHQAVVA